MKGSSNPRVKICCINSSSEAQLAIAAGASAIGLLSGSISEERITNIASMLPAGIGSFLLTCDRDVRDIISQEKRCRTNTIQICDRLSSGSHAELKDALPGVSLVQVIHVSGEDSIDEACSVAPHVDAILLDSGNPELKILGGTGRCHDWQISRRIREAVSIPLFLAGGLHAGNVREAIKEVQPFGIDVYSGVRSNGRLDPVKLEAFFHAARTALQ